MASNLPTLGTLSYNGYTFGNAARSYVRGQFVYDQADRTVVGTAYTIYISTYLQEAQPGQGCDALVEDVRQKLSHAGGELRFQARGFGDFAVNVGGVRDSAWGPKPRLLTLTPVGARSCWRLDWVCEVMIPDCDGAQYRGAVMAFNYEVSYAIDADRLQSRTYSGYLEIPMTRRGPNDRGMPDTADAYRDRINIPLTPGFRRVEERYHLSTDKRRLDFTITDAELPNGQALPAGCTEASGQFSVQTQNRGLNILTVTIAATYKVMKHASRQVAYDAFYALFFDRVKHAKANAKTIVATSYSVTEGLYENARTMSFSVSYILTTTVAQLLTATGIWRPVPNTNYSQWVASFGSSLGPRGYAGLKSLASEDVIVDLCGQASTSITKQPGAIAGERSPGEIPEPTEPGVIDLKTTLDTEMDPGSITHNPLPTGAGPAGGSYMPLESQAEAAAGIAAAVGFGAGGTFGTAIAAAVTAKVAAEAIPQQRTADHFFIRFAGYAVTTWRPIPMPKMSRLGEYKLVPAQKHEYKTRFIGVLGTTPIYMTVWLQKYRVIPQPGQRPKAPQPKTKTPTGNRNVLVIRPDQAPEYLPRSVIDELFR